MPLKLVSERARRGSSGKT
jgi:hypothetical protein